MFAFIPRTICCVLFGDKLVKFTRIVTTCLIFTPQNACLLQKVMREKKKELEKFGYKVANSFTIILCFKVFFNASFV